MLCERPRAPLARRAEAPSTPFAVDAGPPDRIDPVRARAA